MTFEVTLKDQKVKSYQVTALHLMVALALTGAAAVLLNFYPPAFIWSIGVLVASLVLLLVAIFRNRWLIKPGVNRLFRLAELAVLLPLTAFFIFHGWMAPIVMFGMLAIAVGFALYWEQQTAGQHKILIDEQGVKLPPTARRRNIGWPEIEKVILRFGILTVDCEDNRLFQWNICDYSFDEENFHAFCHAHIEAGREKREKDW